MFIRNSKNLFLAIFCFLFVLGQLASPLSSLAATYIFSQDDWTGGESIDVATHANDQDGWTKFLDEEGLETNSGLSSSFLPEQIELTDDIDFSGGDNSQTRIDGSGANALVELGKTGFVDAKIFSNGNSTYALKPDGTLYAWGSNSYGQLGDGTTTNRSTPVQVKGVDGVGYLTDVKQVFADGSSAYALKPDGTLYAWGYNYRGRLGDGTTTNRSTPVQVKGVDGVGYLTDVEQFFTSDFSAYALKTDGTLYAWGYNNYGQLGDGTTINRSTPTQVKGVDGVDYLTDVEQVFAGGSSVYALKSDGTLYAWGYNPYGQLGDGTTTNRYTPVQVKGVDGVGYLTDVEQVFAYDTSVYALKTDGTLYAWGYNYRGKLGDGTTTNRLTPVQVKGVDGVDYLTDVEQVSTGQYQYSTYAIKTDGTLYAWGDNYRGQLGDGTNTSRSTPVQVKGVDGVGYLTDVEQVSTNDTSAYALKTDGTLYAWGYNNYGQLGDGTTTNRYTPVQVKGVDGVDYLTDVEQVSTGQYQYSTYAIKTDGTLYAWGRNDYGQLGDGTLTDKYTPVLINKIEEINPLDFLEDVIKVYTRGYKDKQTRYALKSDGTLYAWGYNYHGQLGDGTTTNRLTPVQVKGVGGVDYLTDVEQVFAYDTSVYALKSDGTLYAWGYNPYGQLGDGTTTNRYTPVQVKGVDGIGYLTDVEQVFAGGSSAYALKSDGTLYAWGYNNYGQLGDGTTAYSSPTPVQVKGVDGVDYLTDVEQVFAGGSSAYALKTDGTLYAWGHNRYGQLGDGTTTDSSTPIQIKTDVKQLFTNNNSAYALKTDGTLYAWGKNDKGQLGDGTTANILTPVQIKTDVKEFLLGFYNNYNSYYAYALKTDGTLYAWGYNNYGQLGDGTTTNSYTPIQVKGVDGVGYLTDVEQVFAYDTSVYALKSDGTLYAWGNNVYSKLGDGTNTSRSTPVQVKGVDGVGYLTDVEQVLRNNSSVYALKTDGTLYAWGSNSYGQLGDGTTRYRSTPVQVKGVDGVGYLTDVEQILVNDYDSAYVLKTDGTLYAWGYNNDGQLGDGTTTNSSLPIQLREWEITYDPSFHIGVNEYYSSGTYTSDIIDLGGPASLNALDYVVDLKGQSLTVDVRAGNTLEPDSSWSDWINNLANGADISSLGENRYIQYRLNLSTGNTIVSPKLQSITFNYNKYVDEGYLISSVYDTNDQFNLIGQIDWVLEDETETEYSKFQIRSSANGTDWFSWCGYSDCSGDTYFESGDKGESLPDGHPLISGADDRYIQYKVFLYSAGGQSASLNSVSLSYVVNAPPSFEVDYMEEGSSGVVAYQEDSQEDDYFGKVKIFYSAKDIDSTSGTNTPNKISPSFSYSIDGGLNWTAISEEDLEEGDMSLQTIEEEAFSEYQAVWDANKTISTIETENAQIKVIINDGELANNIAEAISPNFNLDSKAPTILENITFDAGIAGEEDTAKITITKPEDTSAVYYKIRDNDVYENDPKETEWVEMMEDEEIISWTFDSDIEKKSLFYKFKDKLNNETEEYTVSTHTPIASSSFMIQDTSNIVAQPPYYDVYIGWQMAESEGFSKYKLEEATSEDNITYGDFRDIESPSLFEVNTNYYISRNLNPDLFYKYRLSVINTEGNTSVRSGSAIITKPDGVQNYGEGGGGSVSTAPKVENVRARQNEDKSVTAYYKITDDSFAKKINPDYESYLFLNLGIKLSENTLNGNFITVSDASKMPNFGYIQINNEVIKYGSKDGNNLIDLTRGTWPNLITTGRTTRTNPVLYQGTPVWLMVGDGDSIVIDDEEIRDGLDLEIEWDAQNNLFLAGEDYEKVGIRVLTHDNQDALSGPLSTQNDYTEDGMLDLLDLSIPEIYFEETQIIVAENTDEPVILKIKLSRPYVFDIKFNVEVTGSADYGLDYLMSKEEVTILAGEDTAEIIINIIDDDLKEDPETIIITLINTINSVIREEESVAIVTIEDDESFSGVNFDIVSKSNTENISLVEIPISLGEISGIDVLVKFKVEGTATEGKDFILENKEIIILKGEKTVNLQLLIIDDTLKEEDETVIITIIEAEGAIIGDKDVFTYTIIDDDTYPIIKFNSPSSEAREDINVAEVPVVLSFPYPEEIVFYYNVIGGTAEGSGVDYRIEGNKGIIPPNQTVFNIPIIVYDDDLSEETETIIIELSEPTNAILGQEFEVIHVFSILDNEILISEMSGAHAKSTSVNIIWTTADYTDSLIEYGTEEDNYDLSKYSIDKVLEHNVYIDNLIPNTTYYFKTTSENLAGDTTVSRSQFTTTPGPVLEEPETEDETDTSVIIKWESDTEASSKVYYSTDPDMTNPSMTEDLTLTTDHSVLLNNLTPDQTYYFYVLGLDEEGNEGENKNGGNYFVFYTRDDETPPIISNIKIPIRTSSQVAITWNTNEPAKGLVRYGEDEDELDEETEYIYLLKTNHLVTIDELKENTKYYYEIEMADKNNNESISPLNIFETTAKERVVVHTGSGIDGITRELYDLVLAENQTYKDKYGILDLEKPEVSDIEVSEISAFGATISFSTNEDTLAFVKYGKNGLDQTVAKDKWSRRHLVRLTGLSLGTEYSFVINAMNKVNEVGESEVEKFTTKYLSEDLAELKEIENVEQFQKEIESTIESILPSLVPPFIEKPTVKEITESSAVIEYRTNIKTFPVISYAQELDYKPNRENPYDGEVSSTIKKSLDHSLKISGLRPNTTYHFSAGAYSLPGVVGKYEDLTFTTKASKIQANIIDIQKDSFGVVWHTDEPSTSIIEYKNTRNGRVSKIVDDEKKTSHSFRIENLDSGTTYEVLISGINPKGNLIEGAHALIVNIPEDNEPPIVTNLKVDSALVQGRTDRVQTIISWQTDEASTSIVYYQEGAGLSDSILANKEEDLELSKNHVIILGSMKPGTVYRFTISSTDQFGNTSTLPIRTIVTPKKNESIIDVIFKNFDETFKFINNIR